MKKNKIVFALCIAASLLVSCASTPKTEPSGDTEKQKVKKEYVNDPPNVVFVKQLNNKLAENDIQGAIDLFELMPKSLRNDTELTMILAALYFSTENYSNALDIANQVLAIEPENLSALEMISLCQHATGDAKSYKETADKILAADPYNAAINIQRGQDYARSKKYKLARDCYRQALKGDNKNPDALFGYAQMSYFLHDDKAASTYFQKILDVYPTDSSALTYMGKIAYAEENYSKAFEYFDQALKYDPNNYDILLELGSTYRYLGKYNDAINTWIKATEIEPDYFLAYTYLAGVYDEKNMYLEALDSYKNVFRTNPKYYFAYESAAILEYYLGNYQNAIQYFTKASQYSNNFSYPLMIAVCYEKLGDKQNKKNVLNNYMKKMDKNSTEYLLVRFYSEGYNRNAENSLLTKIKKEDNSNKRGKMLFYMGLYYELNGSMEMANDYYSKVTNMQAPMFFEYRFAEWSLGL